MIALSGQRLAAMFCLAAALGGCATETALLLRRPPADLPRSVELAATPFFPQERFQCGPAALAMVLSAAGIAVSPQELAPQVYVPQRSGSFALEMLAAGRRNGAFSVVAPPRLDALLAETAAGTPVLVLQNLGLSWFPVWHYAVVIGYDLDAGDVVLRSGTSQRLVMPLSTFEHTWQRGGAWGMLALAPDRLPKTVPEKAVVEAAIAFEKGNPPALSRRVYATALRRWPENTTLLIGLGNTDYAAGDKSAAAAAFARSTQVNPNDAPAWNNLALVLSELDRLDEARAAARRALAIGGEWETVVRETMATIEARGRSR